MAYSNPPAQGMQHFLYELLVRFLLVHKIFRRYMKCPWCKKTFTASQSLGYHMKNKVCLPKEREVHTCNDCKAVFSSKQKLHYHVDNKVCLKTREPMACGKCKKAFGSKQAMDYHVQRKVCEKVKAYCTYCEKRYRSKEKLDYHLLNCYQHFCGNKRWHETRCTMNYLFTDMEHLRSLQYVERAVKRKREIDVKLQMFDKFEGVRWEYVKYWETTCPRCGHKRKDEHIWTCLMDRRNRVARNDPDEVKRIMKEPFRQ